MYAAFKSHDAKKPLLDKTKSTIFKIETGDGRPGHIAVCCDSDGYSIKDGRVVLEAAEDAKLPSPCLFLRTMTSKYFVLDFNGNIAGKVFVTLDNNGISPQDDYNRDPCISNFACDDKRKWLLTSDTNFGCVYITNLAGTPVKTVSMSLTMPIGVWMDDDKDHLYVCNSGESSYDTRIVVFDLKTFKKAREIKHESLSGPSHFAAVGDTVYVVNYVNKGSVSVFSRDDFSFLKTLEISGLDKQLKKPFNIRVLDNSRIFITEEDRVLEISADATFLGDFQAEVEEGMKKFCPRSIVIGRDAEATYLFLTDYMNYRIFRLKLE